jgi:hypothetical protein
LSSVLLWESTLIEECNNSYFIEVPRKNNLDNYGLWMSSEYLMIPDKNPLLGVLLLFNFLKNERILSLGICKKPPSITNRGICDWILFSCAASDKLKLRREDMKGRGVNH